MNKDNHPGDRQPAFEDYKGHVSPPSRNPVPERQQQPPPAPPPEKK